MSRRVQIAAGVALAILLMWLFLRQAELDLVMAELRRADYRWVALASGLTLLITVHRAWRWQYLLLPIKRIGMGPLTSCTFMGWAFTALLPGRLGEVARPVLLGRREGISKTAAFATIVLERLFDLLAVLLLFVIYQLFFPLPAGLGSEGEELMGWMRLSGVVALGALMVAVGFLAAAQRWPDSIDAILVRFFGWMPRAVGARLLPIARSFMVGFAGIKGPRLIATIVAHSLVIWFAILVSYWLLFFAFDIDLPFYATIPLIVIVVAGVMVPTPAAVGAFHAATLLALHTLWGVPREQAISYAIICHAMVFVPITAIGIVLLFREGLSVRSLDGLEDDRTHP